MARPCCGIGMLLFCMVSAGAGLTVQAQNGYVPAAENDRLALYYKPDSLAILVRDKATGYEYDSAGVRAQEGDLNTTWVGMKESGVSVECRLENGSTKTWSITAGGDAADGSWISEHDQLLRAGRL